MTISSFPFVRLFYRISFQYSLHIIEPLKWTKMNVKRFLLVSWSEEHLKIFKIRCDLFKPIILHICQEVQTRVWHYLLGCNDFNNLVLLGRWWLQNLILRHIYKYKKFRFFHPFRLHLSSKFVKRPTVIWKKKMFFFAYISTFLLDNFKAKIGWKGSKN